jgi:ubiquinone/menaquinone biosynthesis C-methylase UbiE
MKMNNGWNKFIYQLWAPIYDATVDRFFVPGRKRALELLDLRAGERVLLAGIGTGADLPFIPECVFMTGVDISPHMLAKAREKRIPDTSSLVLVQGDAQALLVEKASFDAVIFNLILSVIPDGNACLISTTRALKPGGRAVVFDKFLPEGTNPSLGRRIMNFFSTLFGTNINRRLSDLMKDSSCEITYQEPSIAGGLYRIILLKRI